MALYDQRQSLPVNLQLAGLTGNEMGRGNINPMFLSAIQTAMARAGRQGYGGQEAFDLISSADRARSFADPIGYANELLSKAGVSGFSSAQELNAANTALPGHNEGAGIGEFLGSIPGELGRVGGELASERGVQALALAAGGGAMMGGGAGAGSAAAGGTGATGGGYFGGLSTTGSGLGLSPAASGVTGLTAPASGLGSLSPGFFAAESLPAFGAASGVPGAVPPPTGTPPVVPPPTGGGGISSLLTSPAALGIGAGALLGGLGGSKQAGNITVEEGIPDWLQPYVKPALDKYSTDLQNYQIDPQGIMPSAMKQFQDTISGQFLDPSTNKYLEDYFRLGAERVKGSLSPSFGHMQAFGQHSGYNEALSRGLGDLAVGLYGGAYEKERDRQNQMIASAPAFLGQSSQAAFQPYSQYLQSVGSLGKKKEQPYFESPFGNILGGALVGGSLGNMFK